MIDLDSAGVELNRVIVEERATAVGVLAAQHQCARPAFD